MTSTRLTPRTTLTASPARRRRMSLGALLAVIVIAVAVLAALWPHGWLPHDPLAGVQNDRMLSPGTTVDGRFYLLGTDPFGRDVFSVVVAGARVTVFIVVCAELVSVALGVTMGLIAGTTRGWPDAVIARLSDIQLAFPVLVLLIASAAAFGSNLVALILILGVTGWAPFARLVRAETISVSERSFVEAATLSGLPSLRVLFTHILPNVTTPVLGYMTIDLSALVIFESSLAYLGAGVQPPTPSWGAMTASGQEYIYQAPWLIIVPGLVIFLLVLALNVVGDHLRDRLDTTMA